MRITKSVVIADITSEQVKSLISSVIVKLTARISAMFNVWSIGVGIGARRRKINKMGKTVVRFCDICKREIKGSGFRMKIKRGKRFYLGLINMTEDVDICEDCISVISDIVNHKISIDVIRKSVREVTNND